MEMEVFMRSNRYAQGFTFIELSVSLVLLSILAIVAMRVFVDWRKAHVAGLVAGQTVAVSTQFARYEQANYNSLVNSATWPVVVTTAQVAAASYPVPTGPNAFGQTYEMLLIKDGAGALQPANCAVGGMPIPSDVLRRIAEDITDDGGSGGFIDVATSPVEPGVGSLFGANGLNLPVSTYGTAMPGQGHFCDAIYFSNAVAPPGVQGTALQRLNVPGYPQDNQMETTLDMNNNAIVNGSTVSTKYLGAMGLNPSSGYPTGWSGGVHTWDMYAEGTVGAGSGGTLMASMNSSGNFTGANMNLTGSATVGAWFTSNGDGGLLWNAHNGSITMSDNQWIRMNSSAGTYISGQMQAGTVVSNGRMTAQEFIQLNGTAAVGTGCSPAGLAARDSGGGGWMQCGNDGVWHLMQGITSEVIEVSPSSSCAPSGPPVTAACPATYVVSGGWPAINGYYPSGSNTSNRPDMEGVSGNGYYVQAGSTPGGSCFVAYAVCVR